MFLESQKRSSLWGTCIGIYPGQYYDNETGLHYNWHRYYDQKIGRYLRADPLGLAGMDPNLYGYVLNDPVNAVDPFGLSGNSPNKWAAIRTLIQIADIIPIPHPAYQVPMEIAAFATTMIDVRNANVHGSRKAAAVIISIYGLAGVLQSIPTLQTVAIGTLIDLSSFVAVSYLLGDHPGKPLWDYIQNNQEACDD